MINDDTQYFVGSSCKVVAVEVSRPDAFIYISKFGLEISFSGRNHLTPRSTLAQLENFIGWAEAVGSALKSGVFFIF
jgi:hypothetical protein